MHPEQVIDRVLILFSAEPVMRHRRPGCHPRGSALPDQGVEFRDKRLDLILRRLRLIRRGHVSGIDPFDHLRPAMGIAAQFEITRELVDAQFTLLTVRTMTVEATLCKEGFKRFRCVDGSGKAKAGDEQQE